MPFICFIKTTPFPFRIGRCVFIGVWGLFFDILDEVADGVFEADDDLTVEAGEDAVYLFRVQNALLDFVLIGERADDGDLDKREEHAQRAHDDGVAEVERFAGGEGRFHESSSAQFASKGEYHDDDTGDEAGNDGRLGDLFTVQSVQEGREEGTGECAPADTHQRGDLAEIIDLLDDGDRCADGDKDDEQDTHNEDLFFLGHFFFFNNMLFDKVER